MPSDTPPVPASPHPYAKLDRLGDEIAELSAHLDAATGRLLELIREFDARSLPRRTVTRRPLTTPASEAKVRAPFLEPAAPHRRRVSIDHYAAEVLQ
jgi:hypothetical protein